MKRLIQLIILVVLIGVGKRYLPPVLEKYHLEPLALFSPAEQVEAPAQQIPHVPRPTTASAAKPGASTAEAPPKGKVEVYRWKDGSGQWHFSTDDRNAAPADEVEKTYVSTDINLIQGGGEAGSRYDTSAAVPDSPYVMASEESAAPSAASSAIAPAGAQKALNDAIGVQKMINAQKARTDAAVANIR